MLFANVLLVSGSANFSTRDVWEGYRVALLEEGIRVIPYPTFSLLKVLSVDAVCNDILGTALDVANRIDCVVFVDGLYFRGERARVPLSLRRAGLATVLIATDDPYETIPNLESLYTCRFTNEIHCATGGAVYLPTATLLPPQAPRVERPRYDVSFLGTVFDDRRPLLLEIAEFCEQQGLSCLIAGKFLSGAESFESLSSTEVRQRTIDSVEKWEIYSQSRLTINLFRESETPADSPSPRVFEVAAFGQAALATGPTRTEVSRAFGDSLYYFEDAAGAKRAIHEALRDTPSRIAKVDRAREIAIAGHLYQHRAKALIREVQAAGHASTSASSRPPDRDDRVAWIVGCGRTGSTWLADMLGDVPKIRRWHEPYFGRFFRHLHERPDEAERRGSFFFQRHQQVWVDGLRDLFFRMVHERFPQFGNHALVIKEVNTPELYPWIQTVFPQSHLILLQRDPFDVLDSHLDMQKPGGWNDSFQTAGAGPLSEANVRHTCEHIRKGLSASLATYDVFPLEQRLLLRYEDLLERPAAGLEACAQQLAVAATPSQLQQAAAKHSFDRYKKTGPLEFRRAGKAGNWRESENMSPQTLELAEAILGPLRGRLGYG